MKIKRNRNSVEQPDRYQHEALFEAERRRHLHFPSRTAREVAETLQALGVHVEPQRRLGTSLYALDFYLPDVGAGILLDEPRPNGYRRGDAVARKRALCRALGIEPVVLAPATDWVRQLVDVVLRDVPRDCPAAQAA